MLKTLFISLFICCFALQIHAQDFIDLPEAIKKGWVQSVMQGNPSSTHYIKPLRITLTNTYDKLITVKLEAGSYFSSEPADFQDIVNTAAFVMSLQPKEQKIIQIYGVCTEASNKAPSEIATYKFAVAPKAQYALFAKFIEKEQLFGTSEAQHGMWAISDDKPLEEIYGNTDTGANGTKVREFVAKLLNKPLPKEIDMAKHYTVQIDGQNFTNYSGAPRRRAETSGKFYYELAKKTKVLIGMFDVNNILIREIYYKNDDKAGKHTVQFAFDSSIYPDDVYVFKLITDEKMWIGMEMDKRKMRPVRKN